MNNPRFQSSLTRRRFVGQALCAGMSCAPFFSTLLNLSLAGRVVGSSLPAGNDYRALVCLFLGGGNDSFNMLAPRSGSAYDEYKATRHLVAFPAEELLPIGSSGPNHPELGLHPSVPEMKALFDANKLAFVANVGTLVAPMTVAQYNTGSGLPRQLFSHLEQPQQWMTGLSNTQTTYGWFGRAADLLRDQNTVSKVSMNISLDGNNMLQFGHDVVPYCITPNGTVGLESLAKGAPPFESVAVKSLLESQYKSLFEQSYTNATLDSVEAREVFDAAIAPVTLKTVFPDTKTGRDLHMVARTIASRGALGVRRQTFFAQTGGWDFHFDLVNRQKALLSEISGAIGAFQAAMEELNLADQVTLFTGSDFGRTLTSNSSGTDHAWGGNQLVVGGAVKGGVIYGDYPPIALKTSVDIGQGRLIPTTSVDSYSAELVRWFGVPDSELATIFPNLGNFYSASSGKPPVGFIG